MKLSKIIEGLNVLNVQGNLQVDIESIAYDSRMVKENALFVCIDGFNVDGHDYVKDAIDNGAKAIVVEKKMNVDADITVVEVESTRYALASVSAMFYENPSRTLNLIGITGTKGKTTSTFLVESVFRQMGLDIGISGTIESGIGDQLKASSRTTPEAPELQKLFRDTLDYGSNHVVMEVSSQGLKLDRVACSDFDIGVFLNFSRDHIGPNEHESMEDYFESKLKLFDRCKTSLINLDDNCTNEVIKRSKGQVYTFGMNKNANIRAYNINSSIKETTYEVDTPWGHEEIVIHTPGMFNVYNSLVAIGVCGIQGIPLDKIKEGLKNVSVPGRVEVVDTNTDFSVLIDYAHTANSLQNVLSTFKEEAQGRLISVFGCGGNRDSGKRMAMGKVSGKLADLTVITTDNPRKEDPESIIDEIEIGIKKTDGEYVKITDRRSAIEYAIDIAKKDDVIIIAGKGHETYQIFSDRVIDFDEKIIVQEIVRKLKKHIQ